MIILVIIIMLVLAYIAMGFANVGLITTAFRNACGTSDARVAWRRGLISITDHKQLTDALTAIRETEPTLSLDECFDVLVFSLVGYCLLAWPTFIIVWPEIDAFIRAK